MRFLCVFLLVASFSACSPTSHSTPAPISNTDPNSNNATPECSSDASDLSAVSGASLKDTSMALEQLYALAGTFSVAGVSQGKPTTIAQLVTALQNARDALQQDQTTLADAIAAINTVLPGSDPVYTRISNTLNTAHAVQEQYTTLLSEVESLTNTTGLPLNETQTALVALMDTAHVDTVSGLHTAYTNLQTTADTMSSDIATLFSQSGSTSINDVGALINELTSCTGSSSLHAAKNALCPASSGGYAALWCPQGASGGNSLMLVAKHGFTAFSNITSSSHAEGIVSLAFNDGTGVKNYSVDTTSQGIALGDGTGGTSPLAATHTVTLTHQESGNAITFVNTSGNAITSAEELAQALESTFVNAVMVSQNTCAGIASLDALVGGSNNTLETRLSNIKAQIHSTPTNISTDLNNAIKQIDPNASVLSEAIESLADMLGSD